MQERRTIRELLNEDKEQVALGALFYWAANSVLSDSPDDRAMVILASAARLSATGIFKVFIENELEHCSRDEDRLELARMIAPWFAADFLCQMPPVMGHP